MRLQAERGRPRAAWCVTARLRHKSNKLPSHMPLWLDLSPKQAAAEHCCGARVASHKVEQPDDSHICGCMAALRCLEPASCLELAGSRSASGLASSLNQHSVPSKASHASGQQSLANPSGLIPILSGGNLLTKLFLVVGVGEHKPVHETEWGHPYHIRITLASLLCCWSM